MNKNGEVWTIAAGGPEKGATRRAVGIANAMRKDPAHDGGVSFGRLSPQDRAVLRKLVHGARTALPGTVEAGSGEGARCRDSNILLDAELDGVRCLLLKVQDRDAADRPLSPRELEIGRLIAKGYPNKQVAAVLEISAWTVSAHIRRMFGKLRVTSRAALVARMGEIGMMDAPPALACCGSAGSLAGAAEPRCPSMCPLRLRGKQPWGCKR